MKTQPIPANRFHTLALLLAVVLAGMIAAGCKKSAEVPDPKPPDVVTPKPPGPASNPPPDNTNGHVTPPAGETPSGIGTNPFPPLSSPAIVTPKPRTLVRPSARHRHKRIGPLGALTVLEEKRAAFLLAREGSRLGGVQQEWVWQNEITNSMTQI
jgi:hypothetical protein